MNVNNRAEGPTQRAAARRLAAPDRRRQLLETAIVIVREEGADRLTLGHLAGRAGVSKPVVYDHFKTRSGLLIELYRWIDVKRINTFRDAMATGDLSRQETVAALSAAYIECAADTTDEFHAVGAALAGSEEKAAVFQELRDNVVQLFVSALAPHGNVPEAKLHPRCVGLIGAGEALSAALVRGKSNKPETIETFATIIGGALNASATD